MPRTPTRRPAPPPRRRDALATKAALLAAAARLFWQKGYDATAIAEVTAAAGVTKAMVRHHFADKAGLRRAVILEALDHVAGRLLAAREGAGDIVEALDAHVAALARGLAERPHIGPIIIADYASGRFAKEPPLGRSLARFFAATQALLAEGARQGRFRSVDAEPFHLTLVGAAVLFAASEGYRKAIADAPIVAGPRPTLDGFVAELQAVARARVLTKT